MAVSLPLELPLLHRAEVQCGPPASSRSHLETPAPVPAARPPAPAARVVVSAEEVSIRDVNRRARTPIGVPLAAAASRGECLECTRFLDRPTEQGCGVRTGAGGAGALAAGAALGTGEAAKAIAEALKSGKVVLTERNLFFRWSRGDCGRVAIDGTSVLTKLASLASVGTFSIGVQGYKRCEKVKSRRADSYELWSCDHGEHVVVWCCG